MLKDRFNQLIGKMKKDSDGQAQDREAPAPRQKKEKREKKPLRMGTGWLKALRGVLSVPWMLCKIALGLVGTVLLIFLVTGVIFACSMADYLQDDVMPNAAVDNNPMDVEQSSFIYATDRETGEITLLQQIYAEKNRQWASYDEIPENLVNAAIAIEDKRFREHSGVDWFRTGKACVEMFLGGSSDFGGSTITQQYIKNFTGDDDVTVRRKVLEIFRALEYEKTHSKDEIMENYLNLIYLGENCYGVKSASRVYFGKELEELTLAECASLIGITNNPSLYDPYINREGNRNRQLLILGEMLDQELITQREYDEAVAQKMVFDNSSGDGTIYTCPNCGHEGVDDDFEYNSETGLDTCPVCGYEFEIASEEDEEGGYSYFVDAVFRQVAEDLMAKDGVEYSDSAYLLYVDKIQRGGFHIYATIDLDAQEKVDRIYQDLSNIPETYSDQQLQSAIVVVDNATGDIVALAGGVGKKTDYLGYSRATDSRLQTGSSIKPLAVYAPAIELGAVTPATIVPDAPLYDHYPQNYERTYSGYTNILNGVASSLNAVSAQTLNMIGYEQSFHFAKDLFGLEGLVDEYTFESGRTVSDKALAPLSMGALSFGVHVSDMASAYATFPNNGVWREGRLYTKVYDSEGNLVLDNTQETRQVISQKTATYINYMLQYAMETTYTGGTASIPGMTIAGKTGTTSDDRDRWFCGYNHYYTAAVWCGYDEPEEIQLGWNYNPSAVLWNKVMTLLVEGKPDAALYDGSGMRYISLCRDSGKYATDACRADIRNKNWNGSRVLSAYVFPEDYPTGGSCDKHVMVDYCVEGKAIANEYCSQIRGNKVEERSLVKYTEEEVKWYKEDCYITIPEEVIYDEDDVCKLHTKEMLEEQNKPTEPPTQPTEPSAPPASEAPASQPAA